MRAKSRGRSAPRKTRGRAAVTYGRLLDRHLLRRHEASAEDVVWLFKERLADWHQQSWTVDGTLIACFDRNGGTVALDTTGMELLAGSTQKTYALTIDHNGGNCD